MTRLDKNRVQTILTQETQSATPLPYFFVDVDPKDISTILSSKNHRGYWSREAYKKKQEQRYQAKKARSARVDELFDHAWKDRETDETVLRDMSEGKNPSQFEAPEYDFRLGDVLMSSRQVIHSAVFR